MLIHLELADSIWSDHVVLAPVELSPGLRVPVRSWPVKDGSPLSVGFRVRV